MPNMNRLESVVSIPTSQGILFTHPAAIFGSIPLCTCGAQSSTILALYYLRSKDNPTPPSLRLETPEDSLRFQVKENMDAANVIENVIGF